VDQDKRRPVAGVAKADPVAVELDLVAIERRPTAIE
jgi:hypothetical protein